MCIAPLVASVAFRRLTNLDILEWPVSVPSIGSVCILVTLCYSPPVHATPVWSEEYLLQGVPQLCKCVNTHSILINIWHLQNQYRWNFTRAFKNYLKRLMLHLWFCSHGQWTLFHEKTYEIWHMDKRHRVVCSHIKPMILEIGSIILISTRYHICSQQ